MKTSSAKAKGRRLQQWVCSKISEITGIEWGKDKEIDSREMGQSGTDVKLYGEAKEMFKFDVEIKNQETWTIPAWIKQAKSNQSQGRDWMLVVSRNYFKVPIVILDADVFFKIYKKIIDVGKQK